MATLQRKRFHKDPDAVLDYLVDWGVWLPAGDTIAASVWSGDVALPLGADSFTDTTTTIWLEAGGVVGEVYQVVNHITTAQGREEDQTLEFQMKEN